MFYELNSILTDDILINGYGIAKLFEQMHNTLMDMLQTGKCCPDVFTFDSVILVMVAEGLMK